MSKRSEYYFRTQNIWTRAGAFFWYLTAAGAVISGIAALLATLGGHR